MKITKRKYKTPSLIKADAPKIKYYKSRLKLLLTCCSCPEQYDVLYEGIIVGYIRLRHGHLYAQVCDKDFNYRVTVYDTRKVVGDGEFCDDKERERHINKIKTSIINELNNHQTYWKFDCDNPFTYSTWTSGNTHLVMINKNDNIRVRDKILLDKYHNLVVCNVLECPDFKKNKSLLIFKYE